MTTWIIKWSMGHLRGRGGCGRPSIGSDPPSLGFPRHLPPQDTPYSAFCPLGPAQALQLLSHCTRYLQGLGLLFTIHHTSSTYLLKYSRALDLPQHCIDCVREAEWITWSHSYMVQLREGPPFSQRPFNAAA